MKVPENALTLAAAPVAHVSSRGRIVRRAQDSGNPVPAECPDVLTLRFARRHPGAFHATTVLHAFVSNPRLAWTARGLALWYGIRLDKVQALLAELMEWEVIRWVADRNAYVLARPASSSGA